MNRRGFLQSILALGIAPAVARASSLMPIRVLEEPLIGFAYMGIERATYHWWKDPLVDTNIVLGGNAETFVGESFIQSVTIEEMKKLHQKLMSMGAK